MRLLLRLILFAAVFMLNSSFYPVSEYVPILIDRQEMEKAVKLGSPRPMFEPGKIYYKSPWLFIVEKYKGVHIIDNSNPSNPEKMVFLHIDGVRDVAMKGNVLYADNAVDLIAVQFNSSLTEISVSKRLQNYFPEMSPPDGWGLPHSVWAYRPKDSIIVGWKKRQP